MDHPLVVDFEVKKCSSTGGGAAAGPPVTLHDRPQHFFRAAPPSRYTVAVRQKYFLDPVDDRRLLLRCAEGAARACWSHAREQCGARRAAAAPPAWLAVKPQPAASSFINGRWMEAIGLQVKLVDAIAVRKIPFTLVASPPLPEALWLRDKKA